MPPRLEPANGAADGGGFVSPGNSHGPFLPTASTTASSSVASSVLPKPRSHPLRSGSAKETTFINYMDREIMGVTRRYAKKFGGGDGGIVDATAAATADAGTNGRSNGDDTKREMGYDSFKHVAKDLDRLLAVLWVSGTPSLQIQYLLTLALLVVSYIPSFAPAPRAMFRVLEKLDYAFASLVTGQDVDTGETLPGFGFGGRRGLTATEKVRVKSLVERTRVVVVDVMGRGEVIDDEDDDEEGEQDGEYDRIDVDDTGGDWVMEVARVYDRTLVELGDTLGENDIVMEQSE